jgi:alpha-N-arabinofuranosidase
MSTKAVAAAARIVACVRVACVAVGVAWAAHASPASATESVEATLTITPEAAGPRIEPAIQGQFVEHLGTGVYGGLWVGPGSPIPNTRGFRNDVVAALRAIHVPVVRWPGGCFADDYDWRDGIGPPAQRPVRINKVWGGVPDDNRVGTHEFMDFAEQIGADVYIAGNMGSMPPRAMAQWLEYMTADGPSSLAQERRRNGRDKPWTVKYFGVGNESWGCGGHMRPEYAADLHRRYATFLRTPVIRVASGDGQGDDHVTDVMMERAGDDMEAISLHHYTVPGSWEAKGRATGFDAARWARTMQDVVDGLEDHVARTIRIMDRHDPKRRVALFVDEWGMWHDPEPGTNPAFLHQQNTLRDAVVAALTLDIFQRHTERVKMANLAQMVDVLQSLVLTDHARMVTTPTYHVFDLYQPFQGATPLKTTLDAPRWREGDVELPAVDASVARGTDGATVIALVNLDPRRPARVTTSLDVPATGRILTAPAMDAHNTFDAPRAVVPAPYAARVVGGRLVFELPAKSIVVVSIPVSR